MLTLCLVTCVEPRSITFPIGFAEPDSELSESEANTAAEKQSIRLENRQIR